MKTTLLDTILRETRDTNSLVDLRRNGIGGAANSLTLRLYGEQLRCWVSVGDEAQAIKRIEQALYDADDLRTHGVWRVLYLVGSTSGTGMRSIDLCDREALSELCKTWTGADHFAVTLANMPARKMVSAWLGQDLGKFGTCDLT